MERLLARLERRFGRYALENLPLFVVGGMAVVFVLGMLKPEFESWLVLDIHKVLRGQVWRLFTYLFLPESRSPIWVFFVLYWSWMIGRNLEEQWGPFRLNVYYLLGMLGTTIAAVITGAAVGNTWLNLSMLFAFATIFPDYEIRLFLLLPIRMKWVGLLSALGLVVAFVFESWSGRAAILAATGNYFLFFAGHLLALLRDRNLAVRQRARRATDGAFGGPAPKPGGRVCEVCHASQDEGADIRVCSCPKCQPSRNLCLAHARSH
jgi:membrane associated rhomboid family serine protease